MLLKIRKNPEPEKSIMARRLCPFQNECAGHHAGLYACFAFTKIHTNPLPLTDRKLFPIIHFKVLIFPFFAFKIILSILIFLFFYWLSSLKRGFSPYSSPDLRSRYARVVRWYSEPYAIEETPAWNMKQTLVGYVASTVI